MFLKWYKFNFKESELKYLVYLMSFLSNLALDPFIVKSSTRSSFSKNKESEVYFGYLFFIVGKIILVRPILLLGSMERVHKRYVTFSYIGDRPYSIGGFIVGRASSMEMEESSEQTSLLPHLDLRCRRLVVDTKDLDIFGRLNYWFTPIAMLSGLHRWGFSWKRIILSTIPIYILHGKLPSTSDLELISASIVEYVYNRRIYKAYGEERYMTIEAGKLFRELDERIKSFMEAHGNYDLSGTIEFLNNLFRQVLQYIDNDVSVLLDIYNVLLWNNSLSKDSRYKLYILDVYRENLKSINKVINKMISSMKRVKHKLNLLFIMVATETMSPIYLSFFIDRITRSFTKEPQLIEKLNTIRLLLLYTPQVLPQVLYNIYVLKDLGRIKEGNDRTKLEINSPEQFKQLKNKLPLFIDLKPLIDKQPSIVYTELKALLEEYRSKRDSNKENIRLLIAFTPYLTGTVSVLAALKRLCTEYKNNSMLNIKEIL